MEMQNKLLMFKALSISNASSYDRNRAVPPPLVKPSMKYFMDFEDDVVSDSIERTFVNSHDENLSFLSFSCPFHSFCIPLL